MNFWNATNNLMSGNRVRRDSWEDGKYVQFHNPDKDHPLSHFLIHHADGSKKVWFPSREESESEDWEICQ